jgi:hypothetical protein
MGFVSVENFSQFFKNFNFSCFDFYYFLGTGTFYNSIYKFFNHSSSDNGPVKSHNWLPAIVFIDCGVVHLYLIRKQKKQIV